MEITDQEVLARYPWLPIDHDSKVYWKGCLQKKLLIDRCKDCGNWIHYPASICPECWSGNIIPVEVSGKGVIELFVLMHQGGAGSTPYPFVIVALEQQGVRIPSTVVDCKNEDIYIGMPVKLTWIEKEGAPIPAFKPA
jgi:uncharacterized protein